MAEPAEETDVTRVPLPPLPWLQETETMAGAPATAVLSPPPPPPTQESEAILATADPAPRASEPLAPLAPPAAVVEPVEEAVALPPLPPQVTEPTDGVAPALDPAVLPTAEWALWVPPQEEPVEAAVGQPSPSPPPPSPAPPAEAPSQETVATAVEAEKQLIPADAAPAPQQQPPPQQQEGGAAGEASSVQLHEEEKDAAPAVRAQEGAEKPEEKHGAPARAQEGRRRWRHLQAAVRLIFLRCKRAPKPEDEGGETKPPAPGGKQKQPVPEVEETKPTLAEGEKKPSAPDGKQPAASGQEPVATSPPPAKTSSPERAETAADAEKPLVAPPPPPQQPPPPQKQGAGAPDSPAVQEEEKGAAPAMAQVGEENPARRRWRRLRKAVCLLFHRSKSAPRPGDQSTPLPKDKEGEIKQATALDGDKGADDGKPAPDGKQPASGVEEGKQPPPPPQKQGAAGVPEQASSVQEEEKDAAPAMAPKPEGEESLARRRWRRLRAAVRLLVLRPKSAPRPGDQSTPLPKDKEGEPSAPDGTEPTPASGKETQAAPAGETKSQSGGAAGGGATGPVDGTAAAKMNAASSRFQKVGKRLLRILSWYRRNRSPAADGEAAGAPAEEGKAGDEIKPATALDGDKGADDAKPATALDGDKGADDAKPAPDGKKKPASEVEEEGKKPAHPKWPREEERLEKILEDAFTRLLAAEFHSLSSIRQKCLLTFSVFELASEVKKQGMVYWWVSEFSLRHRSDQDQSDTQPALLPELRKKRSWARRSRTASASGGNNLPAPQGKTKAAGDGDAEGIFSELSSNGFLQPMRNWCSRVIHGCKVNPLVHWMLKRRARDDRFADLDVNGNPAKLQPSSSILCLTARNRALLQKMRMEDESQQQVENKSKAKTTPSKSPAQDEAPDKGPKNLQPIPDLEYIEIAQLFKGKRVILNVNAHVYPVSKSTFLHLADCLVVLQLGRWCNYDDNTYMEVDGLESLTAISSLKKLRYLSLRGLSRLTELPEGIRWLKKLVILDVRGCQNLVNMASRVILPLKQLTHLDLTECYMLEYICRGILFLSELQVLKGFVFASGTQDACRLRYLRRLKKLQKLTISITTDANVGRGEMAELKHLVSLRKLTITWSEIPSILDGDSEIVKKKRDELVEKWTNFELPQELLKLDIRCYPKKELTLKAHMNLKKLYLRGGDLESFSIESKLSNSSEETNSIHTLRLRFLKNFNMGWEQICSKLKCIKYLEIVSKDENLMKDMNKDRKDKDIYMEDQEDNYINIKDQKDKAIDVKDREDKKIKMLLYSKLDDNGVWVKDEKEEENLATKESTLINTESKIEKDPQHAMEESKGPIEDPSTKVASINKDGNDDATKD